MLKRRKPADVSASPRPLLRPTDAQDRPASSLSDLPELSSVIEVPTDRLVLAIIRFVGAAYCTGDARYWHAGLCSAEHALGPVDGPSFFARAAALAVAIMKDRLHDFTFLPAVCEQASADELSFLQVLSAARCDNPLALRAAATAFAGQASPASLILAARALSGLQERYEGGASSAAKRLEASSVKQRLH